MGMYLNPGNSGFETIRRSKYVDKSGLIRLINQTIGTTEKLTCVSRPRRFGKSFAAKMLCAYYDKTCDSSGLFEDLEIAEDQEAGHHMNRYDVIYLDMTNVMGKIGEQDIIAFIENRVSEELLEAYPEQKAASTFDEILMHTTECTGNKFIMIIDEWDAPIREMPEYEKKYLRFLRSLFKSSGTTDKIFAAAYMTGILPIKKDGSQSAISDFEEYSVIRPMDFAEYVGFTEDEVKELCIQQDGDFSMMKQWYDGYTIGKAGSVYNPNSVMKALRSREFDSYWTQTSAADSLMEYISLDFDGLSKTIAELLGGVSICVDTGSFMNDLVTFRDRDDVLTLLIHLGYLSYDKETKTVRIPNEEVRLEFARSVRGVRREETVRRVRESDQLMIDTVQGNAEAVAAQIEKIHGEETVFAGNPNFASLRLGSENPCWGSDFLSNEQSLRSVIKLAYFSYKDHYMRFEELPSGDGYVDIVYFPKKLSPLPALVIELKWNRSARGAIAQIKEKRYPEAIKDYGGEILLVGIAYDKDAPAGERKHSCIIEKAV